MNKQALGARLQRLESARVVTGLRIVREVIDTDREVIGAVARPGHVMVDREVGESLPALIERAEASR